MKAGFAERDITPEPGMERPGGYGKAYHNENVHDPCKVRAAVFDDGQSRTALVGVDTLIVPRAFVQDVRARIAQACGIPPGAILIGASHSHSAGPLGMTQIEYDHASPLVKRLAYELSSSADPVYTERVADELVAAVVAADDARVDVKCGVGSGREDKVAYNRRFLMKDGITCTHPGKCNPDIVKIAGPTDPKVGVIGSWDSDGKLLGCVVNFACHGTTGPGGTSADWIYYLEQTIRGVMGEQAVVVFLNGACGDVTQVDNLDPYLANSGERSARYVGGRVGAEAVKTLFSIEPGELTPVAARTKILPIPRRKPSPERLRGAMEMVKRDPSEVDSTEWTFAKEIVMLDALIEKEPVVDVEVQAVQVGPAVFLANPAEFFCQYGLDLKASSQFPFTFPVELANGCVGYVPTEEAMGEHGGGYETRLTSYSNLEITAGRSIVSALLDLDGQLTPGALPMPPKAKPSNVRWSYGNVPPELC
ncbi:hypothetical protein ACFL6S_36200 [Candidatus Poribacteria bacterium]